MSLGSPDRRHTSEYCEGHHLNDGCVPVGYRPVSLRRIIREGVKEYRPEYAAAKAVYDQRPSPTDVLEGGLFNPASLALGTVVRIEQEVLSAERARKEPELLLVVLLFGLRNTNFPWAPTRYRRDIDYAVVTDVERSREPSIRGLVTFGDYQLRTRTYGPKSRRSDAMGMTHTEVLELGKVTHNKWFDRLQANDHQVVRRVLKVSLFV